MASPYNFNDAAVARGAASLGKQLGKYFKEKEKRPDSIQSRADTYLDFAAKTAKARYAHITEADKQQALSDKAAAKARQDKIDRAAATRRATAAHKRKLQQMGEVEDLKTTKQVERAKAVGKAKASVAPKPKAPSAAQKTPSGVSTDKDGVLKPIVKRPKPSPVKAPVLNTKAGDAYND